MLNLFTQYPFLTAIISCILGCIMMPFVIKVAKQKQFIVRPNKRMSHVGNIPNIGGVDICFSFLLTFLLFNYNSMTGVQFYLVGLFMIVVVGFIDDVLILTPLAKLMGEMISGVALIGFAGLRITHLHMFLGIGELSIIPSYLLSFFILVAIINAINLIDGVDGLASGLGIVYCLFFAIYFSLVNDIAWATMAYILIGSLLVFFVYNVFGKSHKIFMGDSGSLLLGYILTSFVFKLCELNAYHQVPETYHMDAAPAVCICVLTIPIFDTIRVIFTRLKQHRSPFQPDKNHIHHLLLRTGLNHIQTTTVLLCVSLCFIALALLGRNWPIWVLVGVDFAIATILTVILWRIIDHQNAQH